MAEARCGGQDQSMRDVRDSGGGRRHPRGSNASAERNKPDQQPSSQGALSSIRAAIMRTSRSTAQEQQRERRHRRPQITILSAEPMAPSWFPAAPPPSAVQVPPPSYEQVLREKTREQQQQQQFAAPSPSPSPVTTSSLAPAPAPSPSASPSHSTIATQTDVPPTPPPIPPQPTLVDNPVARPALRRPPRPPKPPCPPKPDMSTQTPTDRPPDEEPVRPRPRPRSRAGLRPMSEELTGSRPICSESLMTQPINSCIPKSRSLSTDIVVAQPVSSERAVPQPIRRGHAVTDTSSQTSESVCDQSEGVCLGAESVCVGGQYLQDLLDVFGPESNRRHDNEGDPHGRVGEEEEEEERGASGSSGTSPRPQPRPRRRTYTPTPTQTHTPMQTHTPVQTQTQADASGSPPPQPQPRRRSLPVANTTPQGSPPDQPTHMGTGMPARFLPLRPPPPIKLPKSPNLIRSSSTPAPTNQQQAQRVPKRGPPLPPRPKPGHPLHKSSQKEDINLMDLNDTLADMDIHTNVGTQEDVCPDTPRDVNKPVETPVNMPVDTDTHTQSHTDAHTHINKKTEDSEEKSLEILPAQSSSAILLEKPSTSAMCCVAIFAFRGEEEDELSFSEGDVITLTDYVNDEWGRGYLKGHSGIFPLCFASSPQPHSMFEKVEANQD